MFLGLAAFLNVSFYLCPLEREDNLSELRIVLIGRRRGKAGEGNIMSAVGNFILGKDVFDTNKRTVHSVMKQGEVFGRNVTVVNTPDWPWDSPLSSTPMMDQLEIKRGVHLCPPGPHVFLVVIQTEHLEEIENLCHLEEHVSFLFSNRFWMHSMLLLLGGHTSVTPKLEKTLVWFVEKCELRFDLLDIHNRSDDEAQVRQLLDNVQRMVSLNGGGHYPTDRGSPVITMFPKIDAILATNHNCHYKVDGGMLSKLHARKRDVVEEANEKRQRTLSEGEVMNITL